MCVLARYPPPFLPQADGNRPGDEAYDPRTLYIPDTAWSSMLPFERQFWELKRTHYDTVLFCQKGKSTSWRVPL